MNDGSAMVRVEADFVNLLLMASACLHEGDHLVAQTLLEKAEALRPNAIAVGLKRIELLRRDSEQIAAAKSAVDVILKSANGQPGRRYEQSPSRFVGDFANDLLLLLSTSDSEWVLPYLQRCADERRSDAALIDSILQNRKN